MFFFFSSRRRHTRFLPVSWARRCVQETAPKLLPTNQMIITKRDKQTLELEINQQLAIEHQRAKITPITPSGSKDQRAKRKQRAPSNNQQTNANYIAETIEFLPQRGDFKYEFDNDAELLLAEMEFLSLIHI
eukprot:TRINITY_DN5194_c0_g1_i5.p3 TRINITY_DN5194_c0_g1~~TRINITY_DN5194_c0_g1_i5.p3  ORF type:complete len:132 (-),score=30.42 TRINITY_DN5194_c0_g1_i5:88-483(-)